MGIIDAIQNLRMTLAENGVTLTAIEVQTFGDLVRLASAYMKELPESALIAGSDTRARRISGVNIKVQSE